MTQSNGQTPYSYHRVEELKQRLHAAGFNDAVAVIERKDRQLDERIAECVDLQVRLGTAA